MKKILTIFIVFLFIGLTVYPSVQANTNIEMVEVITEMCGVGGQKHTIKLTQEESEEVKEIFNTLIENVDESVPIGDVTEILTDTLLKLNKYGLLVGNDVKQISNFNENYYKLSEIIKSKNIEENYRNYLCLFIGHTDEITLDLNVPFCLGEFIAEIAFIVKHFS